MGLHKTSQNKSIGNTFAVHLIFTTKSKIAIELKDFIVAGSNVFVP